VEHHNAAPETFQIPPEDVHRSLVPTSGAKLIFTMRTETGLVSVERMWVRISGYTDVGYVGELLNEPDASGAPLAPGDRIEFEPDHIIAWVPPPNWNGDGRVRGGSRRLVGEGARSDDPG
jgi:hypothetical protein